MARAFLTAIDLGKNELQNAAIQNLGTAPASPVKGQVYFDTTTNTLFWWDGTTWQSAKGGIAFGTVTAEQTFGAASADGAAATASPSDHRHGNPTHTAADHSTFPLNTFAPPTAAVSMNGQKLTNVATPTAPTDGANKLYVDSATQGLDAKQSVRMATTANINLSPATVNIDGITAADGDRLLVKNQTSSASNGIYVLNGTDWVRAPDADTWAELISAYVWVEQGTTQADTGWLCTVDQGGTLGTTAVTWVQFAGAGSVLAGAGMTKTGNTLDVVAGDTSLTVAADSVVVNTSVIATVASVTAGDALKAAKTTTIATTAPLTAGGALAANRTRAITSFAGSAPGAVPTSPGGTTQFLRADGTWASLPGGLTKFSLATVGGATSQVITHNLGTQQVIVQVWRNASPF